MNTIKPLNQLSKLLLTLMTALTLSACGGGSGGVVLAPETLTAVATGTPNEVVISWAAVTGASTYTLYSTTDAALANTGVNFNPINLSVFNTSVANTADPASTSLTLSLVGDSTTYYVVTATVNGVESFTNSTATAATANSFAFGTTASTSETEVWMDRNLGASQMAGSSTDALAYGDLYQWGRPTDGHQTRAVSIPTTTTLSESITPTDDSFITGTDWTSTDSTGAERTAFLSRIDGSGICPTGFRVPTQVEWQAEIGADGINAITSAFDSLKLTVAGGRNGSTAALGNVGSGGIYWSSTASDDSAILLRVQSSAVSFDFAARAFGLSVRCIKD
ncbi:hypothetical protein SPBRAN_703 [uncultured Candidatus Thioglobus sp.]|nr:hypothetical protein SPBRAN_703 [uncultured Candidatus Thioglobus sp.]